MVACQPFINWLRKVFFFTTTPTQMPPFWTADAVNTLLYGLCFAIKGDKSLSPAILIIFGQFIIKHVALVSTPPYWHGCLSHITDKTDKMIQLIIKSPLVIILHAMHRTTCARKREWKICKLNIYFFYSNKINSLRTWKRSQKATYNYLDYAHILFVVVSVFFSRNWDNQYGFRILLRVVSYGPRSLHDLTAF